MITRSCPASGSGQSSVNLAATFAGRQSGAGGVGHIRRKPPLRARERAVLRSPAPVRGQAGASNRWRRREKAPTRAVRLLAAPVLAVAADLHFLERDDLVEL